MPKGQYDRKTRQIVSPSTDTDRKLPDAPMVTVQSLNLPSEARDLAAGDPASQWVDHQRVVFERNPHDPEVAQIAELLVTSPAPLQAPAPVFPPPVEPSTSRPATYEDWMDEDAPTAPTDDFVTRMVSGWAGTVCHISHQVAWLPADDGASLEVILTTEHGASVLKAPAGGWTEADIGGALAKMREELRA